MPFFDLNDVMFLTNKWDSVENDSSDEEYDTADEGENEKTRTYDLIMENLKREWPVVSRDHVFQLSLKKDGGEYEEEFARFKRKLIEVLEKNKFATVFNHLRILASAFAQIERVVRARVDNQTMNDEEHFKKLSCINQFLSELRSKCTEGRRELKENITKTTNSIAMKFHSYLHTEYAKTRILKRAQHHEMTTRQALKNEVFSLMTNAVQEWLTGEEVESMIRVIDRSISDYAHEIEQKALKIESELYHVDLPYYSRLNDHNANISSILNALLPCTVSLNLLEMIPFGLSISGAFFLLGRAYDDLLNHLQVSDIEECMELSITRKYFRIVDRIHDAYERKEESLRKTIENISQEREALIDNIMLHEKLLKHVKKVQKYLRPLIMNMQRLKSK